MWKKLFSPPDQGAPRNRGRKYDSWDVVVLSFKLLFQQIQFWIRPNVWMVVLSLPILTAPAAKAALYKAVAAGLRDPALAKTDPRVEVRSGFRKHFWRALGLALIKWLLFLVIVSATWFWITRDTWLVRSISVITLYALVMWWLTIGYLYPVLIDNPDSSLFQVVKDAALLSFRKPFDSLLFAVVSTLVHLFGLVLLGPILLIIPAFRAILHFHGYWFVTGQVIPGFMDLVEYSQKYYD